MNDYCVYILDMSTDIRGCVRIDSDGFASIYINARLSRAEQYNVLKHELRHLRRDDMHSMRSIHQVEKKERRCSR